MSERVKRKARDTRELVFYLEEPGRLNPHPVLWGAVVSITIWNQTGGIVQRNGACSITDMPSGEVTYIPSPTDFYEPGVYKVQWRAVYPDGTDARFPSDHTFGEVIVSEALDSRP